MKEKKSILFTWLGRVIVIGSMFFLLRTLKGIDVARAHLNAREWGALVLFLALHVASLSLVAFGWKLVLDFTIRGGKKAPYRELLPVFLKSNAAKYIPGNIFEFVARNVLGARYGWSNSDIWLSSILEALLGAGVFCVLIGCLFAVGAVDFPPHVIALVQERKLIVMIGGAIVTGIGLIVAVKTSEKAAARVKQLFSPKLTVLIVKYGLVCTLILSISSGLFVGVLKFVVHGDVTGANVGFVASVFLASAFAGYVVPGAAGGLGVRETLLVLLLGPDFGPQLVLLAALFHRAVSIVGDALGYLIGGAITPKRGRS